MLLCTGLSDWADGYAAKRLGQSSVLGSYLDPLADKVLVCCTVGALAAEVLFLTWHLSTDRASLHVGCTAAQTSQRRTKWPRICTQSVWLTAQCFGTLAYVLQGSLPMPLAGLIIGRDVLLVGGAFVHRAREARACSGIASCACMGSWKIVTDDPKHACMHAPGGLAQSGLGRVLQDDRGSSTACSRAGSGNG